MRYLAYIHLTLQHNAIYWRKKIIIKHYRSEKGYETTKLLKEFLNRGWTLAELGKLLKKLDETGSVRKKGSGRQRIVRTEETIDKVSTVILSQDDKPGTHETPNQILKKYQYFSCQCDANC